MLHEMLLTRPLFRARIDQQTATRILYSPIPKIRMRRPDCPQFLESIVLRALERDVDHRFQSAEQMHAELDRFAQAHSIVVSKSQIRDELNQLMDKQGSTTNRSLASGTFGPITTTPVD
jgi:serine/threonine protein kinase